MESLRSLVKENGPGSTKYLIDHLHCFYGGTVVGLQSRDRFQAIRELLASAPCTATRSDLKTIEDAVVEREKILSTALGRGVAVAHGNTKTLDQIIILLGISHTGIDFQAWDGMPVHQLFLIAHPPDRQEAYLLALAALARLIRNRPFLASIAQESDAGTIERRLSREFRRDLVQRFN